MYDNISAQFDALMEQHPQQETALFKLHCDNKYLINFSKTLPGALYRMQQTFDRFVRNTPCGRRPDNMYYDLFCYLLDNPDAVLWAEPILVSEDTVAVLKAAKMELDAASGDPGCLNSLYEPYIPKGTIEPGREGWISDADYVVYKDWLCSYEAKSRGHAV